MKPCKNTGSWRNIGGSNPCSGCCATAWRSWRWRRGRAAAGSGSAVRPRIAPLYHVLPGDHGGGAAGRFRAVLAGNGIGGPGRGILVYAAGRPVRHHIARGPPGAGGFRRHGPAHGMVAEFHRRYRNKAAAYDREAALREGRERLAAFAEATFEGIVESDAGRIVDCNEQLGRMPGYSVAEPQGTDIRPLPPKTVTERWPISGRAGSRPLNTFCSARTARGSRRSARPARVPGQCAAPHRDPRYHRPQAGGGGLAVEEARGATRLLFQSLQGRLFTLGCRTRCSTNAGKSPCDAVYLDVKFSGPLSGSWAGSRELNRWQTNHGTGLLQLKPEMAGSFRESRADSDNAAPRPPGLTPRRVPKMPLRPLCSDLRARAQLRGAGFLRTSPSTAKSAKSGSPN